MAHSHGGRIVRALAEEFLLYFENNVFFVAITASTDNLKKGSSEAAKLLNKIAINYTTSDKPLGTSLNDDGDAVPKVNNKVVFFPY